MPGTGRSAAQRFCRPVSVDSSRSWRSNEEMPRRRVVTKDQLEHDLRTLGVAAGQRVMLHASVKAVGWIVGGPDTILRALLDLLTPRGTLMMLAGWADSPYDLGRWPKAKRRAYLEACPAFDPATSRADHRELSILAEYLRTTPGAVRSRHPLSSYVAVGAHAEAILNDHPLQYHHGPDSPLAKFCARGGRVLLLGALFGSVTLLHHAEHLADVPDKRVDRYRLPVWQDGKRVWLEFEEFDTTNGVADWPGDYFGTIVEAYLAAGRGHTGTVGHAPAYLLEGADLVGFGKAWMERHFVRPTG